LLGYSVVRRVRVLFRCRALVHHLLQQDVSRDPLSAWVDSILATLKAIAAADSRSHEHYSMKAAGDEDPGDRLWTYPLTSRHRLKQLR
jgi:hypothetical protein